MMSERLVCVTKQTRPAPSSNPPLAAACGAIRRVGEQSGAQGYAHDVS